MNILRFKKENFIFVSLCYLVGFFFVYSAFILNYNTGIYEHFEYFAKAITEGRITLDQIPANTNIDWILYNSKIYFHVFPGALIVFLPLYLLEKYTFLSFPAGYTMLLLTVLNFYLASLLASRYVNSVYSAILLGFGLIFSTSYFYVAIVPWTWYFSQAIALSLGLLTIHFWIQAPKRYLLIGFLLGLGFLTRPLSAITFVYFMLVLGKSKDVFIYRLKLLMPLFIAIMLYILYGYLRFNRLTSGFELVNIGLIDDPKVLSYMEQGLFHPYFYIENFYYYYFSGFIKMFSGVGLYELIYKTEFAPSISFFIVSPIFLRVFLANFKEKSSFILGLVILFCFLLLPSYYYVGWPQLGPRYLIDIYALLYFLLLKSFREYPYGIITTLCIIFSALFNFYLLFF